VYIEGYSQEFDGLVEHMAAQAEFTPHFALTEKESAHLVYETRILLPDAPSDLRPGLPARVHIPLSTTTENPPE
jgi:hypothetical protein